MSDPIPLHSREVVHLTDIDLVACLATLGIPFCAETPYMKIRGADGLETTHFAMEGTTPDGKYETRALARVWEDPRFAEQHPEHPLVYAKFALLNRKRLVDTAKSDRGFVPVRRTVGDKTYTYLVREDGDAHRRLTGK